MAKPRRKKPAAEVMRDLSTVYWVPPMLLAVARLEVADVLAGGPLKAEVIAKKVGAHPAFLKRLLRALVSVGVFSETSDGRFRLNPLAQTLRKDQPGSMRDFVLMIVDDYLWKVWGELGYALQTGGNAFEQVHGVPAFAYLQARPEKERTFMAAMAGISGTENPAVASGYPFGRIKLLVDVGGAHGHMLATILRHHKKLKGILYDQPQVVAGAARSGFVTAPDLRGRCEVIGGNFFETVPEGADGYIMKYIIHDWDDEKSLRILGNCRDAMAAGGRVLVVDNVIAPGNHWGKLLDINMMLGPGGQERTRGEFETLFRRAGLRLSRVISTSCDLSIVEGVAR
jgi:hypothetical protein